MMSRCYRGGERRHEACGAGAKRCKVRPKEGDVISSEVKSTKKKAMSREKK
jgi:hypothetical protein